MFKNVLILALSIVLIQYTEAICNKCQTNGVACISLTEFQLCFEDVVDTSITYECLEENTICTQLSGVCWSNVTSDPTPGCGDDFYCGQCGDSDGTFACTSRTSFTICFDHNITDTHIECKDNKICDVDLAKMGEYPCVPRCKEDDDDFKMCDLDHAINVPQTTTVKPSTTTELPKTTTKLPTTTEEIPISTTTEKVETPTTPKEIVTTTLKDTVTTTPKEIVTTTPKEIVTTTSTTAKPTTTTEKVTTTTEEVTTTTRFSSTPPPVTTTTEKETTITTTELPATTQNPAELVCSQQTAVGRYPYPNDPTCRKYIYCFRRGGVMQTTFLSCPNQLYYDASINLCTKIKPQGCI